MDVRKPPAPPLDARLVVALTIGSRDAQWVAVDLDPTFEQRVRVGDKWFAATFSRILTDNELAYLSQCSYVGPANPTVVEARQHIEASLAGLAWSRPFHLRALRRVIWVGQPSKGTER